MYMASQDQWYMFMHDNQAVTNKCRQLSCTVEHSMNSLGVRSLVCWLQVVQQQLNQASVEHAAVMSQLRALHSAALEEVRWLRQQQSRT